MICFNYTPEICVGETNNIWNALQVANMKPMYSNPEDTPFQIFQYTPLSQVPIIIASKLFDAESLNYAYKVMVVGRLSSLILNIMTFYFLFLLLKNCLNVSRILSLTAAICGFGLLTHLSFSIRPDAMSLFFSVYSVYLFSKAYLLEKINYYILCGFTFALSFFVKQDSFLILSALGLCLLLNKSWKNLLFLSLSFTVSIVLLLFIHVIIFGEYFFTSIFGGLSMGHTIEQAQVVFERFLQFYSLIFYLVIIFGYLIVRKFTQKKEGHFLLILTVVSFLIAMATSFKLGSGISYYIQFVTYSILLIFYVIHQINNGDRKFVIEKALNYLTMVIVSLFIFQQVFHYTSTFLKYGESKTKYLTIATDFSVFKRKVEEKKYVIFSFDKYIKLIFFKNIIFPNTEYYHVSDFSFNGYRKLERNRRISHIIKNCDLDDSQFTTLNYYHISFKDFKEIEKVSNYLIYTYEH